jgi:hypothetical protein
MFETFNSIEAALWILIGVAFAVVGFATGLGVWHKGDEKGASTRKQTWIAAITFIVFGLSDIVEIRTGAWWRPWWLLVWKALCVITLLVLLLMYRHGRKNNRSDQPH